MLWDLPSSNTWKSSGFNPGTGSPFASVTTTSTRTSWVTTLKLGTNEELSCAFWIRVDAASATETTTRIKAVERRSNLRLPDPEHYHNDYRRRRTLKVSQKEVRHSYNRFDPGCQSLWDG